MTWNRLGQPDYPLPGVGVVSTPTAPGPPVHAPQPVYQPVPIPGVTPDVPDTSSGKGIKLTIQAALGRLGDTMESVNLGIDQLHKYLRESRYEPFSTVLSASVNSGAAAPTYLVIGPMMASATLGGPAGGYKWALGRWVLWGTDPFTPVAGAQAALFKAGSTPPSGSAVPNLGLVAFSGVAGSIPWGNNFGAHSLIINPTEDLFFVVKTPGNNQNFSAEIEVVAFNERRVTLP